MAVRVSLPDRVKCVLVDDEIEVGLAVSVPGRDDAAGALIVSCMQSEEQRCNACLEARSARVVRDRREPAHRQNDGLPYRIDWRVQRHRVVRGFWIDGAGGCTPPPATGRRAAAGLYALRPFYFVRPDRAWARARQSFPCSATAMLILRRGGGRPSVPMIMRHLSPKSLTSGRRTEITWLCQSKTRSWMVPLGLARWEA
jgi:hypothetical protein